jgi:hypothetical protein
MLFYLYTFHGFGLSLLASVGVVANDNPMYFGGAPYDVRIDEHFWLAIIMQGIFANVYLLALGAIVPRAVADFGGGASVARYRAAPLLGIAAVALTGGIAMWLQAMMEAVRSGQRMYLFFKEGGGLGVWYPVSRVLFDIASMSLGGGIGALVSQVGTSVQRRVDVALLAPAAAIGGVLALTMGILGDRATLLGGITFGLVVATRRRHSVRTLVAVGLPALFLLNVIGWLREGGRSLFDPSGPSFILGAAKGLLVTGEASVTFSMYATLRFGIPTSNGLSVLYVLEAIIPRFLRPVRTIPDAFDYYSDAVGLPPHGWGLHFATDAYINFGIFGLVAGALVLAGIHGSMLRRLRRRPEMLFPLAGLLAGFPIGFRAGIPGLKTMAMGLGIGYVLGLVAKERPQSWAFDGPLVGQAAVPRTSES